MAKRVRVREPTRVGDSEFVVTASIGMAPAPAGASTLDTIVAADAAGKYYGQALASFDNYYLALGGLAKVHAAQGDYAEAIKLYERAVAIIPQPDLLAALGDVRLQHEPFVENQWLRRVDPCERLEGVFALLSRDQRQGR